MRRIKKRVLIVDNSSLLKESILEAKDQITDYIIVGFFKDVNSAYLSFPKTCPEIVVISIHEQDDVLLPSIAKIKNQYPSIKILIQSDLDDDNFIFELLTIGLAGFVNQNHTWSEVKKCLDEVVAGFCPTSPMITKIIFEAFQLNRYSELSHRQNEILKLMVLGGTSNSIAGKLHISKETAKTHMKNIYRKLHVHSKEQALSKAIEDKLILLI
jgi:DNA-binding NarL/FixJ family response regulator